MYVKLFGSILDSSIWGEAHPTRILWITLLAMADQEGVVRASFGGLTRRACLSPEECKAAMEVLEGPDFESKDQSYAGRRVERVDGGWAVLNYKKYREIRTDQHRRDAERQRNHRTGVREFEKRLAAQGGRCGCCDRVFETPHSKFVVLDHDHTTGIARALLCQSCNKIVGQVERGVVVKSRKADTARAYVSRFSPPQSSRDSHMMSPQADAKADAQTDTEKSKALVAPSATSDSPNGVVVHTNGNGNGKKVGKSVEAIISYLQEVGEQTGQRLNLETMRDIQAQIVFAYWAKRLDHEKALLDPKRKRVLIARLVENRGIVSELLYAVDGALRDPWTMGKAPNSQRAYDDIETIFRDRSNVERFALAMPDWKAGKMHPMAIKYGTPPAREE